MQYSGINAVYPFEIPDILCPNFNSMAGLLGVTIDKLRAWETDGDIPARSKTTEWHHDKFWTDDEAKEVFIKGLILMHKGS